MGYIECPQCGQRALSVATHCPRCGVDFPSEIHRRAPPKPPLRRLRPILALGGTLLVGIGVVALIQQRSGSRSVTAVPAPPAQELAPTAPADSSTAATPEQLAASEPSAPPRIVTPAPAPAARQHQRYAKTWVNVRQRRTRKAPTVRVLNPGEPVVVDSLRFGWYRVVVDSRMIGYATRSFLDTIPPSMRR